ncbi:hypothetical protein FPV67DRAFT_1507191 [Lyophyllum atratum]|nr:hypothetical protein FPV67DRAFT_1507191 [Lyophyllum atratum]
MLPSFQSLINSIRGAGQASADRNLSDTVSITVSQDVRACRVVSIVLHGSVRNASVDEDRHVHWRLYFQIDNLPYRVEFNSEIFHVDGVTRLWITERPVSSCAPQSVTGGPLLIPMISATLTVQNVIDLVLHKGRDRYKLSIRGDGCRFWCRTVLNDLVEDGWVAPNTTDRVQQHIRSLKERHGPDLIPYPVYYQGSFY